MSVDTTLRIQVVGAEGVTLTIEPDADVDRDEDEEFIRIRNGKGETVGWMSVADALALRLALGDLVDALEPEKGTRLNAPDPWHPERRLGEGPRTGTATGDHTAGGVPI